MTIRSPRFLASLMAAALALSSPAGKAAADESWIGVKVVKRAPGPLRILKEVKDDDDDYRAYVVRHVQGDWLWLESDDEQSRGWLPSKQVVRHDAAMDHFDAEIQAHPTAWAYGMRGWLHVLARQGDLALSDLNEAIRLDGTDPKMFFYRSQAYVLKRDSTSALADLNEAVRLRPGDARMIGRRGMFWIMVRNYERAIQDFDDAIKRSPRDAAYYGMRATARFNRNESSLAIADLTMAIRLNPGEAEVFAFRGSLRMGRKGLDGTEPDFDGALADFHEAIRLNPHKAIFYLDRGTCFLGRWMLNEKPDEQETQLRAALADFSEAIRLDPTKSKAYECRGLVHQFLNNSGAAISDFQETVRLDPTSTTAYEGAAWLLAASSDAKLRDGKRALQYATKACELTGWKKGGSIQILAAACAEAGDFDSAVKWEQKAKDLCDDEAKRKEAEERLALYREHKPYHVEATEETASENNVQKDDRVEKSSSKQAKP